MTTKEVYMGKLEGKVALITGGNSGIGLATAKEFVNEGAYVFITGRRDPELTAAVKEIGRNVTGVRGDVSNLGDLDRLFAQIKREKSNLDIVFANAGVAKYAPFAEITEEHYDSIFHIDVKDRVVVFLSYLSEWGILRNTGIRKHDIEIALLSLDLCEEAIQIAKVRHVPSHAGHVSSDLLYRRRQLRITTPGNEDVRALVHKLLRSGKADAAIATSNQCNSSFKFAHMFLLSPNFSPVPGRRRGMSCGLRELRGCRAEADDSHQGNQECAASRGCEECVESSVYHGESRPQYELCTFSANSQGPTYWEPASFKHSSGLVLTSANSGVKLLFRAHHPDYAYAVHCGNREITNANDRKNAGSPDEQKGGARGVACGHYPDAAAVCAGRCATRSWRPETGPKPAPGSAGFQND